MIFVKMFMLKPPDFVILSLPHPENELIIFNSSIKGLNKSHILIETDTVLQS